MSRSHPDLRPGSRAGKLVRRLLAARHSILVHLSRGEWPDLAIVHETRDLVPLLMDDASALQIIACARAARRHGGAMAEAGVFMGGSARLICEAKGDTPLHLFDVFETLQGPSVSVVVTAEGESAVRAHFGKTHGRLGQARELLARYRDVHFHVGVFPESAEAATDLRFGFVHLDLDLPESTLKALEFFHPRLVPGGIIVGDDFTDPGVHGAFDVYFAGRGDTRIVHPWGQVVVVKNGDGAEDVMRP